MNGHRHVSQTLNVGNYVTPILAKADPSLFKNSQYVQAVNHSNVRLTLFNDISPFIVQYFDLENFTIAVEILSLGLYPCRPVPAHPGTGRKYLCRIGGNASLYRGDE